ncbi:hypothetical protein ACFYYR_15240 [Streptomyces sp. NPDC001922]|uniref:hypothetical protein n=1 Tax=Streptomyces sp. NPDC001922 TaxID=3364624 RepID=UPI0036AD1952
MTQTTPAASRPDSDGGTSATLPPRTPRGVAWRAAVVLVVAACGITVGGWCGGLLMRFENEFATGPAFVAALPAAVLAGRWLRAGNGFLSGALLGQLLAALAVAELLHSHLVSAAPPYLQDSGWARFEGSLAAVGTAVILVSVVWGAISGYRRPRDPAAGQARRAGA